MARSQRLHQRPNTFAQTTFAIVRFSLATLRRTIHTGNLYRLNWSMQHPLLNVDVWRMTSRASEVTHPNFAPRKHPEVRVPFLTLASRTTATHRNWDARAGALAGARGLALLGVGLFVLVDVLF